MLPRHKLVPRTHLQRLRHLLTAIDSMRKPIKNLNKKHPNTLKSKEKGKIFALQAPSAVSTQTYRLMAPILRGKHCLQSDYSHDRFFRQTHRLMAPVLRRCATRSSLVPATGGRSAKRAPAMRRRKCCSGNRRSPGARRASPGIQPSPMACNCIHSGLHISHSSHTGFHVQ